MGKRKKPPTNSIDKGDKKIKEEEDVQLVFNEIHPETFVYSPIFEEFECFDADETEEAEEDGELEWSKEELKTLITRVNEASAELTSNIKFSTALEKIDWEKIKFNNFTAVECKNNLTTILNKIRKFRTLNEVLADVNIYLDNPSPKNIRIKHPDMPKKPISPFFKYFKKNLKSYQEKHGKIPLSQLSKMAAADYAKLSAKKKAKHREKYLKEFEEYREKFKLFKDEHPELFPEKTKGSKSKDPIQKPQTPFQLFFQSKSKNYESENKKDLTEALRTKWNNLKEKKKIKWIKKSEKDVERYKLELEEYIKTHPDYEPKFLKPILSRAERELKYKFEGRPLKPPGSGYTLYSKIMLSEIKDVPTHEKMVLIAKKWKEMSDEEKEHYNKVAEKEMSKYIQEFDAYIQQLPEEEREMALKGVKLPNEKKLKVSVKISNKQNREALKYSAMMAFQFQELPKLEAQYINKSKTEIMKIVNDTWEGLSEEEKGKYYDMVQSFQDFMPESTKTRSKKVHLKDKKAIEFESLTGVKRPSNNGFSLFTKEYFAKNPDLTPKEKMVQAGEAWKNLNDNEKQKYNKQAKEKFEDYIKQLNQYKNTTN